MNERSKKRDFVGFFPTLPSHYQLACSVKNGSVDWEDPPISQKNSHNSVTKTRYVKCYSPTINVSGICTQKEIGTRFKCPFAKVPNVEVYPNVLQVSVI